MLPAITSLHHPDNGTAPSPAALAGARAALLRRPWRIGGFVHWVRVDPVLCRHLLTAWARAGNGAATFTSLADCLDQLGRPLLQALLCGFPCPPNGEGALPEASRHALKTAAVARRLALATGYARPEEAYLAALLRNYPADAVAGTGLGPYAADAVRYCGLPTADLASAHPLVGLVGVAAWAVDPVEPAPTVEEMTAAAALVGLRRDVFAAEVTRGRNWARRIAARLRGLAVAGPAQGDDALAVFGRLQALQESWLLAEAEGDLVRDIVAGARVLCPCTDALLLLPEADGRRLRLAAGDATLPAETAIDLNLGRSAFVAAFQSAGRPSFIGAEALAGLPVVDRQVAALAGGRGVLCLPLPAADGLPAGLLVLGQGEGEAPAADAFLLRLAEFAGLALAACRRRSERQRRTLAEQKEDCHRQARHAGHEAGNALTVIKNYLTILQDQAAAGQVSAGGFRIVHEEVDRVAAILRQISRPAPAAATAAIDLNRLIRDCLSRFSATMLASANIETVLELDPEMPAITTDADLLRQVLLNLWRNAAEAMAEGGRLKVATTARVNWSGRAYAEISVRDSGAGIDGEQLAKVFHPVASRKGGDHEGIGLAIVRASVARLGGEVSCRSGRLGSEFLVLIPWQPPAAEPAQNRKGSS